MLIIPNKLVCLKIVSTGHMHWLNANVLKNGAANNDQGIAVIIVIGRLRALKLALKSFTGLLQLNNALRYSFQININFAAETLLNIARPFLGSIPEKFEVYGPRRKKWKPALLRKIPQDQLRPSYEGGEDWKSIPFL